MLGVGQIVFGPISDRIGRRPVLIGGALLFATASFCLAASSTANMFILPVPASCRCVRGPGCHVCDRPGCLCRSSGKRRHLWPFQRNVVLRAGFWPDCRRRDCRWIGLAGDFRCSWCCHAVGARQRGVSLARNAACICCSRAPLDPANFQELCVFGLTHSDLARRWARSLCSSPRLPAF